MVNTRMDWVLRMLKIAGPVLDHLAQEQLLEKIPAGFHAERKDFIALEAFGRTLCGIAPWLEVSALTGQEKTYQALARERVRSCIAVAVDPGSKDYMNFGGPGGQPLVDTAFLAHAIVRAPTQLFFLLPTSVQKNLVAALKKSRCIQPCVSNWLLFTAMVETALFVMGECDWDKVRVDYAVQMFETWYKGDGAYGDGADFHWDYYNSFVIHPMYVDILRTLQGELPAYKELLPAVQQRAGRYAAVLERMIQPEGTYPVFGRSVAYRFGAFQMLSQAALQHLLPGEVTPPQVRCALTAVIEKVMESPNMFDDQGWLLPGVYGHQPELAEGYICIGSLYLCCTVFLVLGLPPEDAFWQDADCSWTAKKIWAGESAPIDHAL